MTPRRKQIPVSIKWVAAAAAVLIVFVTIRIALDPFRVEHWYKRWRQDRPIDFYGVVVDGAGKPLNAADVVVRIRGVRLLYLIDGKLHGDKEVLVQTDPAGGFELRGYHGSALEIRSIDAPGRLWLFEKADGQVGNSGYGYSPNYSARVYVPDPAKPAVFPMIAPWELPALYPSGGGHTRLPESPQVLTPNEPFRPKEPSVPLAAEAKEDRNNRGK